MKKAKIIIIVILVIVFIPLIILGILLNLILNIFNKKSNFIGKLYEKIAKKTKKITSNDIFLEEEKLELTVKSKAQIEEEFIKKMIAYHLEKNFKIKLRYNKLEKFEKEVIKKIKKDYAILSMSVYKAETIIFEHMTKEFIKEVKEKNITDKEHIEKINKFIIKEETKENNELIEKVAIKKDSKSLESQNTLEEEKNISLIQPINQQAEIKNEVIKKIAQSSPEVIENLYEHEINEVLLNLPVEEIIKYSAVELILEIIDEENELEKKSVDIIEEKKEENVAKKEFKEDNDNLKKEIKEETKEETKPVYLKSMFVHEIDDRFIFMTNLESGKEEIEDKNYEFIDEHINYEILKTEKSLLIENLDERTKQKLENYLKKLYYVKDVNENAKINDYNNFENELNDSINDKDVDAHNAALKEKEIEKNIDLNKCGIKKIEDLNNIPFEKSNHIEVLLIKERLNKMVSSQGIFSKIKNFIKSKIFRNYTESKLLRKDINFLNDLVTRNINFYEENSIPLLNKDILTEDEILSVENVNQLDNVHNKIISKHPGLRKDPDYQYKVKRCRDKLDKKAKKVKKKVEIKKMVLARKQRQRVRKKYEENYK